jgi:NAD(P)-dependent dehydrogenase (short-subunit alcohol dehydrogenase family)
VQEAKNYSAKHGVDLRVVELDVTDQKSVDTAVAAVLRDAGRLDILVHNAGHMVFGPAEAFTPEQLAELYDVNVLGTQRVNRAVLPHMRKVRKGLLIWVSSSSARGGTPPYLGPYFAAKAGMDSLAVSYAGELARWGIETSIVVPGVFTKGTNHFPSSGHPADEARAAEYAEGPCKDLPDLVHNGHASLQPEDADVADVARAMVKIVDTPFGKRPFRVTIDPSSGGAEVVNMMADRVRAELLRRYGLADILVPHANG